MQAGRPLDQAGTSDGPAPVAAADLDPAQPEKTAAHRPVAAGQSKGEAALDDFAAPGGAVEKAAGNVLRHGPRLQLGLPVLADSEMHRSTETLPVTAEWAWREPKASPDSLAPPLAEMVAIRAGSMRESHGDLSSGLDDEDAESEVASAGLSPPLQLPDVDSHAADTIPANDDFHSGPTGGPSSPGVLLFSLEDGGELEVDGVTGWAVGAAAAAAAEAGYRLRVL
jgi:hypothetical protein